MKSSSETRIGSLRRDPVPLRQATVQLVLQQRRLEGRGFVVVRPDARDRRRRAIALTESGRAAVDAAVKVAGQITRHTLTPLTAAQQKAVIRLLRKLR